jgi:atypical dual specificity phosphatase
MNQNSDPALPKNFSWLDRSKLAGCARPETESELRALRRQGVEAIISLTGTPLLPSTVNRLGFEYLHSHISGTASPVQLHDIIQFIEEENAKGKPVLVHCGEGKGRTGMVLAAYLVYHGISADEAIKQVRSKRPGSIENLDQENAVRVFERNLK